MSEQRSYKFEHISDLTELTDGDIEKFCSELPKAIKEMKGLAKLVERAGGRKAERRSMIPYLDWTNDGKAVSEVRLKVADEEIASFVIEDM